MSFSDIDKYKIVIVGDSNVGKTSIMNTFLKKNNNIPTNTIGSEYSNIHIQKYNQELQIWDCAGQERFRSLTKLYYRNASACIFVFDLNNIKTLNSISNFWISNVKDNIDDNSILLLIGNKSDLSKNTNYDLINEISKTFNMQYIECSAIKNININNIFEKTSDLLFSKKILNNNTPTQYIYNDTSTNNIDLNKNNNSSDTHNFYSYC